MTDNTRTSGDRALCAITAHFIQSYRVMASLGLLCTALAMTMLLGLILTPLPMLFFAVAALVVVLGVLERYYALRLQFDYGLFTELARSDAFDLSSLDVALTVAGLRREAGPTRDLISRVRGTLTLFRSHVVTVVLQLLALMCVALCKLF
jgi:hypothetical protein